MSDHLKADIYLLLTTLLAAAGWIFSKEAVAGLPPLMFMALRFSSAGLLLALIGYGAMRRLSAEQWRGSAFVGLFFGVAMVFWILGLHLATHLGVGAFLTSLGVVMVPLVGRLFGERPNRFVYLSLPCIMAGMACLSLDSEFVMGWGEACFLLSALFISLTFVLNSRAAVRVPTLPLTAVQLMVTGLVTAGVSLFAEPWQFNQPAAIWGWFLASVLIATSLRFFMQTRGQGMAPASHTAIIMTLEPVWTAILAGLWFAESMSLLQFTGCVLIFLAMLVNRWPTLRYWFRSSRA